MQQCALKVWSYYCSCLKAIDNKYIPLVSNKKDGTSIPNKELLATAVDTGRERLLDLLKLNNLNKS